MYASSRRRKQARRGVGTPTALIATLCVLVAIVIVILTVFVVIPALKDNGESGKPSGFFDPLAKSGNLPGKTQEEIQAELDKIVEEGMFNISIASFVTLDNPNSQARLCIVNIPANHHHMKVTITLDGDNEIIYESAGLAPGQYIEYAPLNRRLPTGEYSATALFTAYDTGDLSKVGQAAAKITIVVGS